MDQRQLAELRRWATRLHDSSPNDELRAAGKAILLLTEEIAQLNLRLDAAAPAPAPAGAQGDAPAPVYEDEPDAEHGPRAWFRRTLGMGPEDELDT